MALSAEELRIGNLCHYHVVDKLYDPPEYDVVNTIDYDDIRILSKYEDGNFKPIPLTEEWLLKFKFGLYPWGYVFYINEEFGVLIRVSRKPELSFWLEVGNGLRSYIKYVHQLQNLYFALTGEELTRKDE